MFFNELLCNPTFWGLCPHRQEAVSPQDILGTENDKLCVHFLSKNIQILTFAKCTGVVIKSAI